MEIDIIFFNMKFDKKFDMKWLTLWHGMTPPMILITLSLSDMI